MIKVYFDGSCEPINPRGIATYGYVVYRNGGKIREDCGLVGVGRGATNNMAEYTGLIRSLEYLIYTNRVNSVVNMLPLFRGIRFKWIPREEDEEADYLSGKAYYEYLDEHPEVMDRYKKYMISDRQKSYIIGLYRKLNKDIPEHFDKISKREGSKLIDNLLKQISER